MSNIKYFINKLRAKLFNSIAKIENSQSGFSVLEVILAAGIFAVFSISTVSVVLQGFDANRLGSEETIANQYASEGIEAVRSIKNQNFSSLVTTLGTGISRSGSNVWIFSGTNNTFGKYARAITISDVQRDGSGNIVASGIVDPNIKKVVSTVSWNVSPTRNNSVVLTEYMSNWRSGRGGMLVYGDGGNGSSGATTFDAAVAQQDGAAGFSVKTFTHTVANQSNRLLFVVVSERAADSVATNGVTYNGANLTKLDTQSCGTVAPAFAVSCKVELWYMIAPATGAHTVSVTFTAAARFDLAAVSYYGVDQTTPFGTQSKAGGTTPGGLTVVSDAVTSTTSQLVFYSMGMDNTATVATGTQWVNDIGLIGVAAEDKVGASPTTTGGWSINSGDWAIIGVPINAVSSGGVADVVKYRLFDANTDTWTVSTSAFDVDGASTNKALRAVKVYTSSTRNEKIAISRHYDGTSQYIYATVWNGSAWGTPTLLSNWTAGTFLDVQNFDGTYLKDGTFMTVYSDNTVIPKYRIWNGTTWNTQASLTTLGASNIPNYIVADTRPGTNEVMAAFFTQGASVTTADTLTEYWSGAAWSAIVNHSAVSVTNTMRYVDFQWSPNLTTTGALIYADSSTAKTLSVKIFVADGLGSGSWGTAVHGAAQTNNLESLDLQPKPGSNEFQACDKDAAATSTIVCRKITFSGTVPTLITPTNPILVNGTDAGIQRSFDFGFESVSGDPAIMVYSDTTAVPKFKKYTASTATWDAAATSITTTGTTPGVIKTVRLIPQDQGDDMISFMTDANLDVYSIFWNGSGNTMYTTPASKAFTAHGNNGSATTDFWYDFAWDKY